MPSLLTSDDDYTLEPGKWGMYGEWNVQRDSEFSSEEYQDGELYGRRPRPWKDFWTFDQITQNVPDGSKWLDPDSPGVGSYPAASDMSEISYVAPEYVWPGVKIKLYAVAEGSDDAIEPNDINQGAVGNCWFVSALSVVALYPELIKKVLGRYDLEKGIFEFNFFCDNDLDPRSVCVDCRIPVANSYPCYSNSKTPGELWPALLEKAFAKFYGSFSAISGGSEAIAFTNLTGIPSKTIMSSYDDEKFRDPDALWALIAQLWAEGHILGVTFREVSDEVSGPRGEKTAAGGLISGHAYGVLSVAEVGGNRLLRIRNPHGQTEWTGAWSDGSAAWDASPDVAHQVGGFSDSIVCVCV
jgi:hypothetical protein